METSPRGESRSRGRRCLLGFCLRGSCPQAKAPFYGPVHKDPGGLVASVPSTLALCPEPWPLTPERSSQLS